MRVREREYVREGAKERYRIFSGKVEEIREDWNLRARARGWSSYNAATRMIDRVELTISEVGRLREMKCGLMIIVILALEMCTRVFMGVLAS